MVEFRAGRQISTVQGRQTDRNYGGQAGRYIQCRPDRQIDTVWGRQSGRHIQYKAGRHKLYLRCLYFAMAVLLPGLN